MIYFCNRADYSVRFIFSADTRDEPSSSFKFQRGPVDTYYSSLMRISDAKGVRIGGTILVNTIVYANAPKD
ncbi:unnamed protein product [Macrosiphum euphorbiae]|uniref:Uncharacterized protein n=1 Tax=Macrosiphum euphorbiae TaxID=13131 RepID=A0AAV0XBE9_9HEMI|nr:unnamed protein product [Macrosiphum euphorbiae]